MARRPLRNRARRPSAGPRPTQPAAPPKRSAKVPAALREPTRLEVFRERVYDWIRRIPRGKVATYGQIAILAGYPRQARRVGQALGAPHMPADVPWQRVINSQGRVSDRAPRPDRGIGVRESEQERRLQREGVTFVRGKTDLERFGWRPKRS